MIFESLAGSNSLPRSVRLDAGAMSASAQPGESKKARKARVQEQALNDGFVVAESVGAACGGVREEKERASMPRRPADLGWLRSGGYDGDRLSRAVRSAPGRDR